MPLLTLLGTGIALSNSRAVFEGIFLSGGKFIRTPKFGVRRRADVCEKMQSYRLKFDLLPFLELVFGLYALFAFSKALTTRGIWISPFLFIYACGFLFISLRGIGESMNWAQWKFRLYNKADLQGGERDGN